jgi:hypothetical protein
MITMFVTAGLLALLTGFPWAYMQRPKKRVIVEAGETGVIKEDPSPALSPEKLAWQALAVFVMTAAAIALAGMTLLNLFSADDPQLHALLRYYWFRASDIYVPLGAALATWRLIELLIPRFPLPAIVAYVLLCGVLVWDLTEQIAHWPFDVPGIHTAKLDARPDTFAPEHEWNAADWREVCHEIRTRTPLNAKFLTPRQGRTFKWHAQRAEVFADKDIPQDAKAIMNWWAIKDDIHATHSGDPDHRWHRSLGLLSVERLRELADNYGAEYVVIHYRPDVPEFPLTPLFRNKTFGVYQLR